MLDNPSELQIANLTDTQKVNVQIIRNLTSINTSLNDIRHDVDVHNKILITGNGNPSLQERLRNVESFIDNIRYWGRLIGGAIVLQTLTLLIGIIIATIRLLPILEKLAKQP